MIFKSLLLLSLPAAILAAITTSRCQASALLTPNLFGASVLTIDAVDSTLPSTGTEFCNITLTYTHPGQNDIIKVWLGLPYTWNGRFLGIGGGAYVTGLLAEMPRPISRGYAAVATDGGHDGQGQTVDKWALLSPGNVDLYALQNFAHVALNDMTVLGKQLTEAFYEKAITKSYWSGCSTGGRQGVMMAQRYPDAYDGILAAAPATNWGKVVPSMFWPQWVMKDIGYFPPQCELDAITAAAISACDELDGLKDNIIGLTGLCTFDPSTVVGKPFHCGNITGAISKAAATIAKAAWEGPVSAKGEPQWPGINIGAPLVKLAGTKCDSNGKNCTGAPFAPSTDWLKNFVQRDSAFDPYSYTHEQWDAAFHASVQRYDSIIGTSDPDLSEFKDAGGKMITWQGMFDERVAFNSTVKYYESVLALDANATDFYRFYAAPGVEHCKEGVGAQPEDPLAELVNWVEGGVVPETLAANRTVDGEVWEQDLCLYPLSSIYKGGDPALAASYRCE